MDEIIKSVNSDQQQIIKDIMKLNNIPFIDFDPTYSTGGFYKGWKDPEIKGDINPLDDSIYEVNVTNLKQWKSESMGCIVFDPPFFFGQRKADNPGIINKRFSSIGNNEKDLMDFYKDSTRELYRLLKRYGFLIFKCQDMISGRKQYLNHVDIINYAREIGFYCKDIFILTVKNRLNPSGRNQFHARKYHSYFLLFVKKGVKCQ